MGNCFIRAKDNFSLTLSRSDFYFNKRIGRGRHSIIWKATHKSCNIHLAIKEYSKSSLSGKEKVPSVIKEMSILSLLYFPLIVNMQCAFQDKKKLFLGLDLKLGGDLRYQILNHTFTESEIKFILACIVLALSYIHKNNIIHKDVKPENILFDLSGYAFLSDFESSEFIKPENFIENCGTPAYMAPEVMFSQNHGFVSDYFGVGVILYEVMFKTRPYTGNGRKEISEKVLKKQVRIKNTPEGWSRESADFCNKLLKRNSGCRLGSGGDQEVLRHPWLSDVDFGKLEKFELQPGFVPKEQDNFYLEYIMNGKKEICNKKVDESCFSSYSYIREDLLLSKLK